jgi:hypothetical protein
MTRSSSPVREFARRPIDAASVGIGLCATPFSR